MSRLTYENPLYGIVYDAYDDWLKSQTPSTGGTKPGANPPTTTFAQQSINEAKAAQLATGRYFDQLPPGYTPLPGGVKAIGPGNTAMQQDQKTGNWSATFVTAADRGAGIQGARANPQINTGLNPSAVNPTLSPEARPFADLAQFSGPGGALTGAQGMQIPGFDNYIHPGIGIPAEGRQTLNTRDDRTAGTGLNTLYPSGNGIPGGGIQYAPGQRELGETGSHSVFNPMSSSIAFNPNSRGVEPQTRFADAQVSVPGTYVPGVGNANDSNRAYSVPFNIGPSGAALMNIAGNNVQLQSADKGTGYGIVLNAAPSSNVGLTTGRSLDTDPAIQAAQALQLYSALNQPGIGLAGLTDTNRNQYSGYGAGATGFFGGNGGQPQGTYWQGYNSQPAAPPAGNPAVAPPGMNTPQQQQQFAGDLSHVASTIGNNISAYQTNSPAQQQQFATGLASGASNINNNITAQAMAMAQAIQDQKDRENGGGGGYSPGGGGGSYETYATGGRIATGPLGGGRSLVTNGPQLLIDANTFQPGNRIRALMGEDNGDRGTAPNKEQLTFSGQNNSMLNIKPLQPFAGGGQIQTQQQFQQQQQQAPQDPLFPPQLDRFRAYLEALAAARVPQAPVGLRGNGLTAFATGGNVTTGLPSDQADQKALGGLATPTPAPVSTPFETDPRTPVSAPVSTPFEPARQPVGAPVSTPFESARQQPVGSTNAPVSTPFNSPSTTPTYDPLDPSILSPWQQAQRDNVARETNIRNYDYRRGYGGRQNANAVQVAEGDVPATPLPAGSYYSTADQVNRVMNSILGAQQNIRALGPAEDTNPLYGRVGEIGVDLNNFQRKRDLEGQRSGLEATNEIAKQASLVDYNTYMGAYNAALAQYASEAPRLQQAQMQLQQYMSGYGSTTPPPLPPDATNPIWVALNQAVLDSAAKVQGIQSNAQGIYSNAQQAYTRSQSDSPELVNVNARLNDINQQLGDKTEAGANTELAQINQRLSNQQKLVDRTNEVQNLQRLPVPKLSAGILPVNGRAA